jgi:hypothetical protein
MYIPDPDQRTQSGSEAPVRFLAAGSSKLKGAAHWESPNYVTGLAGAFVSMVSYKVFFSPLTSPHAIRLAGVGGPAQRCRCAKQVS